MTTNRVTHKEQCPSCASIGKDNARDNLIVYSDDSAYCFSCGYFRTSTGKGRVRKTSSTPETNIVLPSDISDELPESADRFLSRYGITGRDIALNNIQYSQYWNRLIFPYIINNSLVGWQGRLMSDDKTKPKWYSKGRLQDFIYTVGNKKSSIVVLTEDIISAIRVGHSGEFCGSPVFGSNISVKRLLTNAKNHAKIVVWLDKDKCCESIDVVRHARMLGVNASCVITDEDPKCYSDSEIKVLIENGQSATCF